MTDVRTRGDVSERPPGRLIDIGGYRLHAVMDGVGSPPVVMEAGTWDLGLTWSLVQPEVATFAATLAYDRAGLGWSDPSPWRRTAAVMADEPRALLRALGLEPPRGRHVVAEGSVHMRHYDRPERVTQAIRDVVQSARGGGR